MSKKNEGHTGHALSKPKTLKYMSSAPFKFVVLYVPKTNSKKYEYEANRIL